MLLQMAPQTRTIINIYTVDPNNVRMAPAYSSRRVSSDLRVMQVQGLTGPASNACVLFYGKVDSCNLRIPATLTDCQFHFARGIVVTAYSSLFNRFLALHAHLTGQTETFVFPYGSSHVAFSQIPSSTTCPESRTLSPDEMGEKMKTPAHSQDSSSSDEFSFRFRTKMLFNDRGKHGLSASSTASIGMLTHNELIVPIYDGTVPFTAGGREGKYGFDFSKEHLSALHTVPQLDDLQHNDFVVVGATVTDRSHGRFRLVEFNVSFVMKIGRGEQD